MLLYLTALFLLFWQWTNKRRWRPVFWRRRLKKVVNFFEERSASGYLTSGFSLGVHFFLKKSWRPYFSCHPHDTCRQCRWLFHCQNKRNKAVRYGNVFCSHYYRSKAIGRAETGRWIFWCSAATAEAFRSRVVHTCMCDHIQCTNSLWMRYLIVTFCFFCAPYKYSYLLT